MNINISEEVIHAHLGVCIYTAECDHLQQSNPDPTSIYVENKGEIKEVSKALILQAPKLNETFPDLFQEAIDYCDRLIISTFQTLF